MIPATLRRRSGRARLRSAPATGTAAVALFALFVLWQVLGVAASASAHAVMVSSDPLDGARLTSAPTQVTFTFDEAVQLPADGTAALSDTGADVTRGDGRLGSDGRTVIVPLAAGLPDGAYTVSYRVVSADGHLVDGAIRFGINADPDAAPRPAATSAADPLQIVSGVAQSLVYLGVILAIGTTAASVAIWPETARRRRARAVRWGGWVLLVAATLTRLLVAGPAATGSGWPGVLRLDGLGTTLSEPTSLAQIARLAVLLVAIQWVGRPLRGGRLARAAGVVVAVGILATVAADGHAATGADAWLAIPATMLHLAAMAFWVGGLIVLVTLVIARPDAAPGGVARLRRWSIAAFVSVGALLVTGEYMAWRQLVPLASVTDTAYGQTLLIKLAVVAAALVAAVVSHRVLLRRTVAPTRRRVRAAVTVEASLTIAAVAITTLLVALPPARTSYGPPTTVTAPVGADIARIAVDSTHTGPQQVRITVEDAAGRPVRAHAVTGTIGTDTVAGIPLKLTRGTEAGVWTADVITPIAGVWTVQLSITLDGSRTYATAASYRVWG